MPQCLASRRIKRQQIASIVRAKEKMPCCSKNSCPTLPVQFHDSKPLCPSDSPAPVSSNLPKGFGPVLPTLPLSPSPSNSKCCKPFAPSHKTDSSADQSSAPSNSSIHPIQV